MMNTSLAAKTCSPLPFWLGLTALWMSLSIPSHSQARTVHVLTQTELNCVLQQQNDSWLLVARLLDDQRNGIVGQDLSLTIEGSAAGVRRTQTHGKARWLLGKEALVQWKTERPLALTVAYAGDKARGATNTRLMLDRTRQGVQLQMTLSPREPRRGDHLRAYVLLHDLSGPLSGMPLSIQVGATTRHTTTEDNGQASLSLGAELPAGQYTVVAEFPGSVTHNPTKHRETLLVRAPTTVVIESASWKEDPITLRLQGLCTADGVGGACLLSFALDDRVIAHAQSKPDGSFDITVDFSQYAQQGTQRPASIYATRIPQEVWEMESRSPALTIRIPSPPTVSSSWYLLPLILCFGVWVGYRFVRLRPWHSVRRWWRGRRKTPVINSAMDGLNRGLVLRPGTPQHVAGQRLRQPSFKVFGTIVDAQTGRALAHCPLEWTDRQNAQATQASADGEFGFETSDARPTTIQLKCEPVGYRSETLEVPLPHGGQLHGVQIRMTSLKSIGQRTFQRDLILMGMPWRLGMDSPRLIRSQLPLLDSANDPTNAYEYLAFGPKDETSQAQLRTLFERLDRLRAVHRQEHSA